MSRNPATQAGRIGRPWREVSARVYREERICWLCNQPVDQTLPSKHPMARTADHLVQLCHGGHPTDRQGIRLAHMRCNTARSNLLRHVPVERCACSVGLPCAVLVLSRKRGYLELDPGQV